MTPGADELLELLIQRQGSLHTGDFLDSRALETGLGMLVIQHCALKSHFED